MFEKINQILQEIEDGFVDQPDCDSWSGNPAQVRGQFTLILSLSTILLKQDFMPFDTVGHFSSK